MTHLAQPPQSWAYRRVLFHPPSLCTFYTGIKSSHIFFFIIMRIFIELEILLKNNFDLLLSCVSLGTHGPWYVCGDQRTTLGSQLSFSVWRLNSGQQACTPWQQVFLPTKPSCCHSLQILFECLKIALERSIYWTFRLSPILQITIVANLSIYTSFKNFFYFSVFIEEIRFQ